MSIPTICRLGAPPLAVAPSSIAAYPVIHMPKSSFSGPSVVGRPVRMISCKPGESAACG